MTTRNVSKSLIAFFGLTLVTLATSHADRGERGFGYARFELEPSQVTATGTVSCVKNETSSTATVEASDCTLTLTDQNTGKTYRLIGDVAQNEIQKRVRTPASNGTPIKIEGQLTEYGTLRVLSIQ